MKRKLLLAVLIMITIALGCCISLEHTLSVYILRMLFKGSLLALFFNIFPIKLSKKYLIFIGLILLSDVLSFFTVPDQPSTMYAVGISFFLMYWVLIMDAWKHFKIGSMNWIGYSYYIFIALVALLIATHLKNIYLISGLLTNTFVLQCFYYAALYAITVVSLAYYLNSYSKKSMFFLLGSLLFVFSDILWGFYFSFKATTSIVVISSIFSVIGYVFFVWYFHTREKSLLLEAELLIKKSAEEKLHKKAA